MTTPTEARSLAHEFLDTLGDYELPIDHKMTAALRSLADQVEALHASYAHSQQQFVEAMQQVEALQQYEESLRQLVDKQAIDAGLWFKAATAPEAYIQQEIRHLHAAIEREAT